MRPALGLGVSVSSTATGRALFLYKHEERRNPKKWKYDVTRFRGQGSIAPEQISLRYNSAIREGLRERGQGILWVQGSV